MVTISLGSAHTGNVIGQLPYLTHGTLTLAGLAPILAYVGKLDGASNPDARLSPLEKAQATARIAHIETEGGDLTVRWDPLLHP